RQRGFLLPEEAGVLDLLGGREGGEGSQPHVDAHRLFGHWKRRWLPLAGNRHVPLARRGSPNANSLRLALQGPMQDDPDRADTRQGEPVARELTTGGGLRIAKAIVSLPASKARIARRLTGPDAAEERFERQVDADGDVLQHLAVNGDERRTLGLQCRQRRVLIVEAQDLLLLFPGDLPFFEQVV